MTPFFSSTRNSFGRQVRVFLADARVVIVSLVRSWRLYANNGVVAALK